VSSSGISTTTSKVEDIKNMKVPTNIPELMSFLGLIQFYAKFMSNLSDLTEPLYRLTRSNVKWEWSPACQASFDKVKQTLTSAPVLAHFTPDLPIGLAADSSSTGLGVVLYHKYPDGTERPISFASKLN
jgi:hypothetical protein